jgi:3-hydroxyacyl-CoA dehydrogenase/enoyl-CoA hydratase/carnithine racemase
LLLQLKNSKSTMTVHVIEFSAVSSNPLNPLGAKLRKHISSELDKALKNKSVTAVVITGGKSGNFSAGADLTEFSQIKKGGIDEDTSLLDVVHKIENFSKPVVAAMRGVALGGGLEVALSCHYRVADTTGKFGLPEVNVGVIPGAGGTLRLPRLVGVQTALSMILTGKPIKVEKAKHLGLIDDIASPHGESLLATALKWAEWAAIMPLDNRRVGKIQVKETPEEIKMICAFAAKRLPPPEKGGKGHYAAMEAVKACTMPIKDGAAIELNLFLKTLVGAEGNAKRHAFFAVRRAQKPLGKPPAGHPLLKPSLKSQTAAVVGAGLMGSGICMVLLQAGFIVYLVDVYKQSLDKGVAFLRSTIKSYVKRGKLTEENASIMQAALKATQKLEDLSSCSLVVEAVIEDMKIKKNIFSSLDKITGPSCIILSNTSTLDVDEMASAVSPARRQLFAGWHFFSPAHIMKLVEIVVGKETSLDTICILQNLTRRVGKIGVVVGNCDGFVGNRLLISYSAETALMLEEGAGSVSAIDSAISNFGMAMGPFRMGDMAGNDIGYNVRKQRGWIGGGTSSRTMPRPARYTELPDILVAEYKRLGQKTGKVITIQTLKSCKSFRSYNLNSPFAEFSQLRAGMTTTRRLERVESHYQARK